MIYERAARYRNGLKPFQPYAPGRDRNAWEKIPEEYRKQLIEKGEELLDYSYPSLPATSYMEFVRNGNRSRFQEKYFGRRRPLNSLIMAECAEWKGRFLDDIVNGIYAICEESGWQLPAHNAPLHAPHLCLPDTTNPILDLFAAETGAQMAMAAYLLGDQLDAISPFIRKRIREEIQKRILMPYLKNRFWWMGGWGQKVNNWTPWITQNTLIAIFSTLDLEEEDAYEVFYQAARSLDYFLEEYGEDGCCNEGPHYYRAAGLCLFNAIEVLNAISENSFIELYQEKKIQNIAAYIMHVHVADRYYANFGDGAATMERSGAREYLFAKRTGNEEMMRYAASDHKKETKLPITENLFYRIQTAFTEEELQNVDCSLPVSKTDIWYEDTGLFLSQDDTFFLAVKAGNNDDSHNHNDTGSIILYKEDKPFLIDIGVETYSKKTFSAERYEIWTMQSSWHNLMTFGNVQQCAGSEYRADVLDVKLEKEKGYIRMELRNAYPNGTVGSYQRTAELIKGMGIQITDELAFLPDGTYLTFMTVDKPEWQEGKNQKAGDLKVGLHGVIEIEGAGRMEIEEVFLEDPKLKAEWGNVLYRSKFYLDQPKVVWRIKK